MSQDLYEAPDYFLLDELLTEEHKLIRDAAREWVKREVSPIIEDACQKAEFPKQIVKLSFGNLIQEQKNQISILHLEMETLLQ